MKSFSRMKGGARSGAHSVKNVGSAAAFNGGVDDAAASGGVPSSPVAVGRVQSMARLRGAQPAAASGEPAGGAASRRQQQGGIRSSLSITARDAGWSDSGGAEGGGTSHRLKSSFRTREPTGAREPGSSPLKEEGERHTWAGGPEVGSRAEGRPLSDARQGLDATEPWQASPLVCVCVALLTSSTPPARV